MSKSVPSTRYIRTPGTLGREDNSLTFRSEKGIVHLPIHGLKELYLLNEISLNSKLFSFLSMAGITVHFLTTTAISGAHFTLRKQGLAVR
ncbi:CRISPR-associated endonuclease Cas1 [Paenibacillus larvae]|nr:CRISPR-associated endonuclease Cas1 [Paenibacillus larvae]MDT2291807.1 CRISPR-associated endonuclease Cas1 [Paenibacillus larvae]